MVKNAIDHGERYARLWQSWQAEQAQRRVTRQ
jgi:hypothetical protein